MLTKEEAKAAFREVMAAYYADVPDGEHCDHTFSPEFYEKMEGILCTGRKLENSGKIET